MIKKSLDQVRRIPAGELPAVTAWQLPNISGKHVVRSAFKEKDEAFSPPVVATKPAGGAAAMPSALANSALSIHSASAHSATEKEKPLTVSDVEKIRQMAHDEGFEQGLEAGRAAGHAQGLEAGRSEGYQAGERQAEEELAVLRRRFQALTASLQVPISEQRDDIEAALLRLVMDTAAAVVNREVRTQPALIQQAVREALAVLPATDEELLLRVNPADEALVRQVQERERGRWHIQADPAVTPGGVFIKTSVSFLDYSVEQRFAQVVAGALVVNGEDAS